MRKWLDHWWRVAATGFSFFLFGLACPVIAYTVFPWLIFVRDREQRARIARRVVAFTFRRFIGIMRGLGLLTYEMQGFERFRRGGQFILANHPSLIDTVFLLGFVPNSTCVVDEVLVRNWLTGPPMRVAGFIANGEAGAVMAACTAALAAGSNLLIFPEGTRTPRAGGIRLRRGAANIAVRAGHGVTPVTIRCEPRTLLKGERWWQVPPRPPKWTFRVGEEIAMNTFMSTGEVPALAVRRLTAYLEELFTSETGSDAGS